MLQAKFFMNSSVEEVISFKCCSLHDQNLEIHLTNTGQGEIRVTNAFDLESGPQTYRVTAVYPPGGVNIPPGQTAAMYCTMDEDQWERFTTAVFTDNQGQTHRFLIHE